MSDNFEKRSYAPLLESFIEAPAAIKAGLGGVIGGAAVRGAASNNKYIRNASVISAPVAALALGGTDSLIGASLPIILKDNSIARSGVMGAALGQGMHSLGSLSDMVSDPSLYNTAAGMASLGTTGALIRLGNKTKDISNTIKSRAALINSLKDPDINPRILRNMIDDKTMDLYTTHALPFGDRIKTVVKKHKQDKYIAKELEEVKNLLKGPGTNYKLSEFNKEAGPFDQIQKNVGKFFRKGIKGPVSSNPLTFNPAKNIQNATSRYRAKFKIPGNNKLNLQGATKVQPAYAAPITNNLSNASAAPVQQVSQVAQATKPVLTTPQNQLANPTQPIVSSQATETVTDVAKEVKKRGRPRKDAVQQAPQPIAQNTPVITPNPIKPARTISEEGYIKRYLNHLPDDEAKRYEYLTRQQTARTLTPDELKFRKNFEKTYTSSANPRYAFDSKRSLIPVQKQTTSIDTQDLEELQKLRTSGRPEDVKTINTLTTQNNNALGNISKLEKANNTIQVQMNNLTAEYNKLKNTNTLTSEKYEKLRLEHSTLANQLKTNTDEIEKLNTNLRTKTDEVTNLTNTNKQLTAERDTIGNKLKEIEEQHSQLQGTSANELALKRKLEAEHTELSNKYTQVNDELDKVKNQYTQANTTNAELTRQLGTKTDEATNLTNTNKQLAEQKNSIETKLKEIEQQHSQLKGTSAQELALKKQLENQYSELSGKYTQVNDELKQVKDKYTQANTTNAELTRQLGTKTDEANKLTNSNNQLLNKVRDNKQEIDKLRADYDSIEQEKLRLQNEYDNLDSTSKSYLQQKTEIELKYQSLETEHNTLKSSLNTLEQEKNDLNTQLSDLKTQYDTLKNTTTAPVARPVTPLRRLSRRAPATPTVTTPGTSTVTTPGTSTLSALQNQQIARQTAINDPLISREVFEDLNNYRGTSARDAGFANYDEYFLARGVTTNPVAAPVVAATNPVAAPAVTATNPVAAPVVTATNPVASPVEKGFMDQYGNSLALGGAALTGGVGGGAYSAGILPGQDQSSADRSATGIASGAATGVAAGIGSLLAARGLARGGSMLLNTAKGQALKQQANAANRGYLRQAFGGLRAGLSDNLDELTKYQVMRNQRLVDDDLARAGNEYSRDLGLGGYGLSDAAQAEVKNRLSKDFAITEGNSGAFGDVYDLSKQKYLSDMSEKSLGGKVLHHLPGGLVGAGIGAGTYAYNTDPNERTMAGYLGSGLVGAGLGAATQAGGSILRGSLGRGDTFRKNLAKELAESPAYRQNKLLGYADDMAASKPHLAREIRQKVRAMQSGTNVPETNSLAVVDGNIKFISGMGANKNKLNVTKEIASDLGAREPKLVSDAINNSINSLGSDKDTVMSILSKGGTEAQEMSDILNVHSKQIVNITNSAHNEIAQSVARQGALTSALTMGGLSGSGAEASAQFLMNQPAMKDLANTIINRGSANVDEIKQALVRSGINLPASKLDDTAMALEYNFRSIGSKVKSNLSDATNSMALNVRSTGTNIAAASHSKTIKQLDTAFDNAKTVFNSDELTRLKADSADLLDLLSKSGPDGQKQTAVIMRNIQNVLNKGDAAEFSSLTTDIGNQLNTLANAKPGFIRATEGVVNSARKAMRGSTMPDNFGASIAEYLPATSNKFQVLDNIDNMISTGARNSFMSGNIKSISNLDDAHEIASAIGVNSSKQYSGLDKTLKAMIKPDEYDAVLTNLNRIDDKLLKKALGNDPGALQKVQKQLNIVGSLNDTQLSKLKQGLDSYKADLQSSIINLKDEIANEARTGGSIKGLTAKPIAERSRAVMDDSGLESARRSATEAPVLSTKDPIPDDGVNNKGVISPYTMGAIGLGGLGLGGYYATRPSMTEAPVQQDDEE